jgi:acetylornithine deacetylase/succinyl-diaminopimelate desuccinylase-like protein
VKDNNPWLGPVHRPLAGSTGQDGGMSELAPTVMETETVSILRDLIRIDTTNNGTAETVGEAEAAEYVAASLGEMGYSCERFQTAPRREGVLLTIEGTDPEADVLLLHGHLDVVPADPADWTVAPFEAEVVDGMVWGRGAVDMKDTDATIIAVLREWARSGVKPRRTIAVAFTPDEEAGGRLGAHWLVENRPEFFHGATQAVGEVGGFSVSLNDKRVYLIQTAERGIAWMRLLARGRAGHGSFPNDDNAITELARAVARIGEHQFPLELTSTTQRLVREVSALLGESGSLEDQVAAVSAALGPLIEASMRSSANPTVLRAGYKHNVIPERAEALIDGRYVPGHELTFVAEIARLAGDKVEVLMEHSDVAIEAEFDVPLVARMTAALQTEDPGAVTLPYMVPAGTDAKAFSRLGIAGYGFAPLQLPADLNFAAMFHGVDERVPIDALRFGVRVMDTFLRSA